ncbi:MAG: hypothetical protein NTY90_00055 [Candidatus Micrarchaeota archaeon]|nr:hypothetical protein [Candidatus Micrarchaeota archaeon]
MAAGWRESYSALRKGGLERTKSLLLATRKEFNPGALRWAEPSERAARFAQQTDAALEKFKGPHRDYFKPVTADEFANYLIIRKKLKPAEAYYHALVNRTASKHYGKNEAEVKAFSLENWAAWKARRVAEILFKRDYNRERGDGKKLAETTEYIRQEIQNGVSAFGKPGITLNVFWGGHKEAGGGVADAEDKQVLDRLKALSEEIRKQGVDAGVNILFSDVHSEKINAVDPERIKKYHDGIARLAEEKGLSVTKMSDVWKAGNPLNIPGWEKSQDAKQMVGHVAATLDVLEKAGFITRGAERAEKHSVDVRKGAATAEEVSRTYSIIRNFEVQMMDRMRDPGAIYVSLGDPRADAKETREKPHMLYLWSLKRGRGKTPWLEERKKQ